MNYCEGVTNFQRCLSFFCAIRFISFPSHFPQAENKDTSSYFIIKGALHLRTQAVLCNTVYNPVLSNYNTS